MLVHGRRQAAAAASPPRTSSSPSSARSAPPAAPATPSNIAGAAIRALSMEGRMTVCNMAIEARRARRHDRAPTRRPSTTSRAGPTRRRARRGTQAVRLLAHAAVRRRREVRPRGRARRREDRRRRSPGAPRPRWCLPIDGRVPDPDDETDAEQARRHRARARLHGPRAAARRSPTSTSTGCSSAPAPTARIEDLRAAAAVVEAAGRSRRTSSWRWSCRAPGLVKEQAEAEGLDKIFIGRRLRVARAGLLDVPGHERRPAGAGRALRLDLEPQFRRPPGAGRRTHLVSPGHGRRGGDRRPFRRRAQTVGRAR